MKLYRNDLSIPLNNTPNFEGQRISRYRENHSSNFRYTPPKNNVREQSSQYETNKTKKLAAQSTRKDKTLKLW